MSSKDTPINKQVRKAMTAIDALANDPEIPLDERLRAINRIKRYAEHSMVSGPLQPRPVPSAKMESAKHH